MSLICGKYYYSSIVASLILLTIYLLSSFPKNNSVDIANSNKNLKTVFATTNNPHRASHGEDIGIDLSAKIKVVNSKYFERLINTARNTERKRKMNDITMNPTENSLQVLINTWVEGSYSPVHKHPQYSEAFIILEGALAFFTYSDSGEAVCHVLSSTGVTSDKAIIVEANQFHSMTAAPTYLGKHCRIIITTSSVSILGN